MGEPPGGVRASRPPPRRRRSRRRAAVPPGDDGRAASCRRYERSGRPARGAGAGRRPHAGRRGVPRSARPADRRNRASGCRLRRADAGENSRVHARRARDAGPRDRRQHRHLQRRQHRAPPAVALYRPGSAGDDRRSRSGWIAGQRRLRHVPGSARPQPHALGDGGDSILDSDAHDRRRGGAVERDAGQLDLLRDARRRARARERVHGSRGPSGPVACPAVERRPVAAPLRGGPRGRRPHRPDERRVVPDRRRNAALVRAARVREVLQAGGAVGPARLRHLARQRVSKLPAPEDARPDQSGCDRRGGASGAQHHPWATRSDLSNRLPGGRRRGRAPAGRDCRPRAARPLCAPRRRRPGAAHRVRERRQSAPGQGDAPVARDGRPERARRRARPSHPPGAHRERHVEPRGRRARRGACRAPDGKRRRAGAGLDSAPRSRVNRSRRARLRAPAVGGNGRAVRPGACAARVAG